MHLNQHLPGAREFLCYVRSLRDPYTPFILLSNLRAYGLRRVSPLPDGLGRIEVITQISPLGHDYSQCTNHRHYGLSDIKEPAYIEDYLKLDQFLRLIILLRISDKIVVHYGDFSSESIISNYSNHSPSETLLPRRISDRV